MGQNKNKSKPLMIVPDSKNFDSFIFLNFTCMKLKLYLFKLT